MARLLTGRPAFGHPGITPRWTRSAKEAIGTAYSASSRVWFSMSRGMVNEVYYPTVDRPQIRDLQYLISDGSSFFHDERRHLTSTSRYLSGHALGVGVTSHDAQARYVIEKEIITNPHQACLLVHTRLTVAPALEPHLQLFALLAPHLDGGGWGNSGHVAEQAGREVLVAHKGGVWLALGATIPFLRRSCGYVGRSDGWTDLADNQVMDWEFDSAEDGNIALTGQLDLARGHEFVLGLAFGDSLHNALTTLFQSLGFPFAEHKARFLDQWTRVSAGTHKLEDHAGDGGRLYGASHHLLLAHEDKTNPGAMIASLSIPWGESKGDEDLGGYHLVWTRDMVNSAGGLLAIGNLDLPLRALIYLACAQRPDGGFYQNFWLDGEPYRRGVQLDEVAFPILLAWRLAELGALQHFDPYPLVLHAAGYLIREGPATPQDRWEENGGLSPSTLAVHIAALVCAASFAADRGDPVSAELFEGYADFLEGHVDQWTITGTGGLVPGISRHHIRLAPVDQGTGAPLVDPDGSTIEIRNQPPGRRSEFPARDVVDGGFLELVRYGIRPSDAPVIVDSVRVIDAVLKVNTPLGPCWHRYNHDGYGEREDGGAYDRWGKGRAWPLLTGERGHYEVAAGRDPRPFIETMERFAGATGLLPEQVWDEPDRPHAHLYFGRPTGAGMPLMWAHAEYLKLLRSARDGVVFDRIPGVAARYQDRSARPPLVVWKLNWRTGRVRPGWTLRVQADTAFMLRWTGDEWQTSHDTRSSTSAAGAFVDLRVRLDQKAPLRFTFLWTRSGCWQGEDFQVLIEPDPNAVPGRILP